MASSAPKGQHGGARPGGGRPKGAVVARSTELIKELATNGVMPLDVIHHYMREWHKEAQTLATQAEMVKDDDVKASLKAQAIAAAERAMEAAHKASPYIHPRLNAVTLSGDKDKPPVQIELFASAQALKSLVRGGGE